MGDLNLEENQAEDSQMIMPIIGITRENSMLFPLILKKENR